MELIDKYIAGLVEYEYEYSLALLHNDEEKMKHILNIMYDYVVTHSYVDEEFIKKMLEDNDRRNRFIAYESYKLKKHFEKYF